MTISYADLWQIAGIAALEVANSNVNLTFKGGRKDCQTAPYEERVYKYVDPQMNRTEMLDWFKTGFDMDEINVNGISIFENYCL